MCQEMPDLWALRSNVNILHPESGPGGSKPRLSYIAHFFSSILKGFFMSRTVSSPGIAWGVST
jgi:hypothetical protein